MSNHYCPVEGCDYPPDSDSVSLSRVRSHINATSQEAHDWDALKPTVLDQATEQDEADDEQPGEQAEGGDSDDPDEERDEYEEQWSSTQNGPDDPPGGAGGAASSTDEGDEADEQATSGESGRELPVSTPVIVVGLALVVLVAFLAMRNPGGEPTPSTEDATDETDSDAEGSAPGEPDIPEEGAWA